MPAIVSALLCAIALLVAGDESAAPDRPPNHLIGEKSVYLQQHAHNPVDWYPWGDEAFARALAEDKPVFVSIGYSTCHWCHVMERESFEDEEIAAFLNRHFISVKVDREERPDVDAVYMDYVQALRGNGGWPLNVFLTAERVPFYGGTYFPPRSDGRMSGLLDLLQRVEQLWRDDRDSLLKGVDQVREVLALANDVHGEAGAVDEQVFDLCFRTWQDHSDPRFGGTRGAPKFPAPMTLAFLLRYEAKSGDARALDLVRTTLLGMADGGIHDQLGGGFARYSTDERWLVPHFEKMLYTQALLAKVYAEAWQRTGEARFAEVARDTLDYVLRDLLLPGGAFASAEDADSAGEEGLFYTWTPAELAAALGEADGRRAALAFGVTERGQIDGRSVLHCLATADIDPGQLAAIKAKLFAVRSARVRPLRDDKVLTAWNGLAISALAFCGRALGEPRYVAAAQEAAAFVRDRLWVEGRLLVRWRDGEARGHGFLDDHAFFAQGLFDLYEADFDPQWLDLGASVTRAALARFGDEDTQTFFDTPDDAETLLVRPRAAADDALPSAAGVMVKNLLRLADWRREDALRERAIACLEAYAAAMLRSPLGYNELVNAALWAAEPPREVVFAGAPGSAEVEALIDAWYRGFHPHCTLTLAPADAAARALLAERLPAVQDRLPVDGKAAAYVCENRTCQAPITDPARLDRKD